MTARHLVQARLGQFFFRWRSYVPVALLVPLLTALPASGWFEATFGEQAETAWDIFAAMIAFSGLGMRIATIGVAPGGTSGRNTSGQRAEALNTTGLYSVVRNPLYLGNAIIVLGLALSVKVWWMVPLALGGTWAFYAQVVRAEEAFLADKFGSVYDCWKAVTPAFLPAFDRWTGPDLGFSLRNVLRREYNGFYLIVVALTGIEIASDMIGEGDTFLVWLSEEPGWILFFFAGTTVWLVLRMIKRRTAWLTVAGR